MNKRFAPLNRIDCDTSNVCKLHFNSQEAQVTFLMIYDSRRLIELHALVSENKITLKERILTLVVLSSLLASQLSTELLPVGDDLHLVLLYQLLLPLGAPVRHCTDQDLDQTH